MTRIFLFHFAALLTCAGIPVASAGVSRVVDFESTGLDFANSGSNAIRGPFPTPIDDGDGFDFTSSSQLTTDGLTLNNDLEEFPGFDLFTGFYASQRTGDQYSFSQRFLNNNDTVTASGSGAGGSDTWVVAFAGPVIESATGMISGNGLSVLSVDDQSTIDSLSINNTALVRDSVIMGDGFAHPFGDQTGGSNGGPDGVPERDDFFVVRFTDLDEGDFQEVTLAEFSLSSNSLFLVEDFTDVDLRSLNASRIGIGFRGSVVNSFGLATPTFVAIDNVQVTSVPEPSGVFLTAILGLIASRQRRRRHIK